MTMMVHCEIYSSTSLVSVLIDELPRLVEARLREGWGDDMN
jgi:hypothetical protein